MDAALNVLFYVPLGVAGVWSFRRKALGWAAAVVAGIALSGLIEWLQLWSPSRFGTLNDLLTNSLGTMLGATVALFLRVPTVSGQLPAGPANVLLIAWFLWHAFPFAPRLSVTRLGAILHPEPWSWLTFGGVLLGAWALGAALDKPGWRWIAYAILPAQIVLVDHGLSYAALAGGAIGLLAAPLSRDRSVQILAWILPLWMVFDELRPFAWREPVAFSWAPFGTWYDAGSEHIYSVLFGKLFVSTATIWCLRRCGLAWWQAVAIPALIIAVGEVAQRWIVGRTPESTDVVLVFIGAILLKLAERGTLESSQLGVQDEKRQVESL